jgi:hypothetical protein
VCNVVESVISCCCCCCCYCKDHQLLQSVHSGSHFLNRSLYQKLMNSHNIWTWIFFFFFFFFSTSLTANSSCLELVQDPGNFLKICSFSWTQVSNQNHLTNS